MSTEEKKNSAAVAEAEIFNPDSFIVEEELDDVQEAPAVVDGSDPTEINLDFLNRKKRRKLMKMLRVKKNILAEMKTKKAENSLVSGEVAGLVKNRRKARRRRGK